MERYFSSRMNTGTNAAHGGFMNRAGLDATELNDYLFPYFHSISTKSVTTATTMAIVMATAVGS